MSEFPLPVLRVPRVFHFIWLGAGEMPAEQRAWMAGWLERHPGWTHRLWTDDNLPPLRHPDLFVQGKNHAQKSDVLRFELMSAFGGVYLDTDVECLKNIEPLLEEVSAGIGMELPGRPGQALLAAVPGHPFFRFLLSLMPSRAPYQGDNLRETGPEFFAFALREYFGERVEARALTDAASGREAGWEMEEGFVLYHPWVFYPYFLHGSWEPERHPHAYAAHHWAKSWWGEETAEVR